MLGDSGAVAITTLLDYYALPADFPGMDARPPKTFHGPLAVQAIGLERVRARCPHFDHWLSWLESL